MKWRRGLFRVWVLLSVCWVLTIGALIWLMLPPPATMWVLHPSCGDTMKPSEPFVWDCLDAPADRNTPGAKEVPDYSRNRERMTWIKQGAGIAIVPPLVVLTLGVAGAWAARGFQEKL